MALKYDIGMIGLGVMGTSLARNMARNGFRVLGYERTTEKMEKFNAEFGGKNLISVASFQELVQALETPRKIMLLVPAGEPVDQVIEQLLPLLQKGDMIIDGGNSHWPDTVRREKDLKAKGILFFGCGVSGGEEGALNGPSMMPGGEKKNYEKYLAPIFQRIAAKDFSGKPCATWIGENGAGHFVKMVHNGIEYAVMQMLAETYDLLRKIYALSAPQIAAVFEELHGGKLESFLTEISVTVLQQKDDLEKGQLIDRILDQAGQKGTGKWTVLDAVDRAVAVPSISEAVNARVISSQKKLRAKLEKKIRKTPTEKMLPLREFTLLLENALSAAMLSSYAQGYQLIATAAEEQKWNIDLAEVSRIWQGGCIIRARILKFLETAFRKSGRKKNHLLELPEIATEIANALPHLRMVTATGIMGGVPLPALSSSLAYLENISTAAGSANFIQALRDLFGAHTFERNDRKGIFHTDWGQ